MRLNKTYAQCRFSIFCDEIDTLEHELNQVTSKVTDDLISTEYAILDGEIDDAKIGYETHRIRNEKTLAIWKLLQEFNPDIVPPMPRVEKKPARNRIITADTARRYISIYGGRSEWIRTDADNGYPVLVDSDGETRAHIDLSGPPQTPAELATLESVMSEIPF